MLRQLGFITAVATASLRSAHLRRTFRQLIDPERSIGSSRHIHGIRNADLIGKPKFADIASNFLAFVGSAKLVAHNASFDRGFLNAELERIGFKTFSKSRVICSLQLARSQVQIGSHRLDTLCDHFGIDRSERTLHGALIDCELLAKVYARLEVSYFDPS
jgi:DNA polymerase-3 subunit epsilon